MNTAAALSTVAVLAVLIAVVGAWPAAVDNIFRAANFTNGLVRVRRGPSDVVASADFGVGRFDGAPMSGLMRFPIGSNTKVFVAVALYQLQEQGLLNITDSIAGYLSAADLAALGLPTSSSYCPQVAGNTTCQTITFEQLLAMSAGIPGDMTRMVGFYAGSIADSVAFALAEPLLFVPGTNYYYSNPSFMLGAYFVEKFSNMSFGTYVRRNILSRTTVDPSQIYYDPYNGKFRRDPKRVEEAYIYIDASDKARILGTGVCSTEVDPGAANGAGGFIGSIDALATWYFTLFNMSFVDHPSSFSHPLFKNPSSLLEIVRPRIVAPGTNRWYAQGVWVIQAPAILNWTRSYPPIIFYEGETLCSHTANFLDVSQSPPLLTQAWRSSLEFYINASDYEAAASSETGMFFDETGDWQTPEAMHNLAWAAHDVFAPSIEFGAAAARP